VESADSGALSLGTTWAHIGISASKQKFVIVIDDCATIFHTILKAHSIGVSMSLAGGHFKIARISLKGSNETLSAATHAFSNTTARQNVARHEQEVFSPIEKAAPRAGGLEMRPCSARHDVGIASALATSSLNASDRSAKVVHVIRRIGRLSDAFDQRRLKARKTKQRCMRHWSVGVP
jgi:hypothetical protein